MPPPPISSEQLTSDGSKLTKKQLKALAFKSGKNAGKSVETVLSNPLEIQQSTQQSDSKSISNSNSNSIGDADPSPEKDEAKAKGKAKGKGKGKAKKEEKGKGSRLVPDGGDLPEMDPPEEQDGDQTESSHPIKEQSKKEPDQAAAKESKNEAKRRAKAEKKIKLKESRLDPPSAASKKRNRDDENDQEQEQDQDQNPDQESGSARKKKLTEKGDKVANGEKKEKVDERKKLILFVGNMSFKVTSQQLAQHFSSTCGETPTVRLLTKKQDPSSIKLSASKLKSIEKGKASDPRLREVSKGCAFLEFKKTEALQKALRFHHTLFEGRVINVELTAGGGGKSENRREKIEKKNKALDLERAKIHSKYIGPANEAQKSLPKKEPPKKKVDQFGAGEAQWGPRASGSSGETSSKPLNYKEKRNAKWSATGVNSVRLGA